MNIISASRRTDIPAQFAESFMECIRDGFIEVPNHLTNQITRVSLEPEDVICIVFWTKNAGPLMKYLRELIRRKFLIYFNYTVTGYGCNIEPNVPTASESIAIIKEIVQNYHIKVRWRYDTVLITDTYSIDWHLQNFDHLCYELQDLVSECIFSFCDFYPKVAKRLQSEGINYIKTPLLDQTQLANKMADIANSYKIQLLSCSHSQFVGDKIKESKCIDADLILDQPLKSLSLSKRLALKDMRKDKSQRKSCGCVQSIDVGTYGTCKNGCLYCYAND